jgi:hypothetical protein
MTSKVYAIITDKILITDTPNKERYANVHPTPHNPGDAGVPTASATSGNLFG